MASDEQHPEHVTDSEATDPPLPECSDDPDTLRRVLDKLTELPV